MGTDNTNKILCNLKNTRIPGLYKEKPWNTYRPPTIQEIIQPQVNSISEKAFTILKLRENLPPLTLRSYLGKIWFKLNYHFNRIFE